MELLLEDVIIDYKGEKITCSLDCEVSVEYHHGDYEVTDFAFEAYPEVDSKFYEEDEKGNQNGLKFNDEEYRQIQKDLEETVIEKAKESDEVHEWDEEDYYQAEFGCEE